MQSALIVPVEASIVAGVENDMRRITRAELSADPVAAVFHAVREGGVEIEDEGRVFLRLVPCQGPDSMPETLDELRAEVARS